MFVDEQHDASLKAVASPALGEHSNGFVADSELASRGTKPVSFDGIRIEAWQLVSVKPGFCSFPREAITAGTLVRHHEAHQTEAAHTASAVSTKMPIAREILDCGRQVSRDLNSDESPETCSPSRS